MSVEQNIAKEIKERGLKIKVLAEKSGIPYSVLQPSLKGHRQFRTQEFFAICSTLNADPNDFADVRKGA